MIIPMLHQYLVEVNGLQSVATVERYADQSQSENDEALILAPGLCSPELADFRRHLAKLGHTAISFDQPRATYLSMFGDVSELRAKILEGVMTQARLRFGIGQCAVIGHSLGGLDALKVAQMTDKDRFSSIELVASAGLTGESMGKIVQRLGHNGLSELVQGQGDKGKPVIWNALRNLPQVWAEGRYGQQSDAIAMLSTIAHEIDTGVMQFHNDVLFPEPIVSSRLHELVATTAIRNVVTVLPGHSCHSAPICNPSDSAAAMHDTLNNRA